MEIADLQKLHVESGDVLLIRYRLCAVGKSLVSTPLEKRRALLNELFADRGKNASPIGLSETMDASPAHLIRVSKEFGFEGNRGQAENLPLRTRQTKQCVA